MYVNTPLKDIDKTLNLFVVEHAKKINRHSNELTMEITNINMWKKIENNDFFIVSIWFGLIFSINR